MILLIDRFSESFRKTWLKRNKPFGLEVLQIRFAGQTARFGELRQRLNEFCSGKIDAIPELDERSKKPVEPLKMPYKRLASSSFIM
jgi:hypothetical protein